MRQLEEIALSPLILEPAHAAALMHSPALTSPELQKAFSALPLLVDCLTCDRLQLVLRNSKLVLMLGTLTEEGVLWVLFWTINRLRIHMVSRFIVS